MMIDTIYGQAEILSPGRLADGSPGYYVILRRRTCHTWIWKGDFVYLVVAKESVKDG